MSLPVTTRVTHGFKLIVIVRLLVPTELNLDLFDMQMHCHTCYGMTNTHPYTVTFVHRQVGATAH